MWMTYEKVNKKEIILLTVSELVYAKRQKINANAFFVEKQSRILYIIIYKAQNKLSQLHRRLIWWSILMGVV